MIKMDYDGYAVIISTTLLICWYLSHFKKMERRINIYKLFPSDNDLLFHNSIIMYSRINYLNKDTVLLDRSFLTLDIKQHSKRNEKIRLYINQRISYNIKLKLKLWLNHIRYKPGSPIYLETKNRWVNLYKK